MTIVRLPIALMATFLWIGFVGAISFMEAWLKFTAPGITIPLGLGIGRVVFEALNKVEWVMTVAIIYNLVSTKGAWKSYFNMAYFIPLILLIVQTCWMLPALDIRAELHIQGQHVPPSNLHFYYVALEVIKVFCLAIFGTSLFKTMPSE